MVVAAINRTCCGDIIAAHIQITIWITIINKTDVTVSIRVMPLTQQPLAD
jgi:hypothetical protein